MAGPSRGGASYDRGMVWHCRLHAHRLRGAGRPQLRRWNASLARGEDAEERRQVIAAIGPLWSWHEVWLVGFGGTLLAVFPKLLASAFAGYYLALFLILWCLISARNLAGSRRPHQRSHVAGVLGFRLRVRQYASGHPLRRGGGQYGPRCSARRPTARSRWRSSPISRRAATWDCSTGIRYPSPFLPRSCSRHMARPISRSRRKARCTIEARNWPAGSG